jgi:hypothetical protein
MKSGLLSLLLAASTLVNLSGCSQLRELTMTKDELRFYGKIEVNACLDPTVICITGN